MANLFHQWRLPRDPGLNYARGTVVTMGTVLASFFTAWSIETAAHLHTDVVVLSIVLALSAGRVLRSSNAGLRRNQFANVSGIVLLQAAAMTLASVIGSLMSTHVVVGAALFSASVAGVIWIRKFGPTVTWAGSLVSIAFVVALVTPADPRIDPVHIAWIAVIAAATMSWAVILHLAAVRTGFMPPASPPATRPGRATGDTARGWKQLPATTRMAVQMGCALGAAFAAGHWLFGEHWQWAVLTAYIVGSGNRGRGDVIHKSMLRLAGAATGTVIATLLSGYFGRQDPWLVVVIFLILAVASWLRNFSYFYWAASITSGLALMYAYFGLSGTNLLAIRLEAIACGAVLGAAAAWFVLPIRTTDVLKRHTTTALTALTTYLADVGEVGEAAAARRISARARYRQALTLADNAAPTLASHRRFARLIGRRSPLADTRDGLRAIDAELDSFTAQAPGELSEQLQESIAATRAAVSDPHWAMSSTADGLHSIAALLRGCSCQQRERSATTARPQSLLPPPLGGVRL
jgi:hypothetical protein